MATFKRIEDIEAWQRARFLSKKIYLLLGDGSFSRDFPLKDQISRSSGSIMDNIAEGFERGGNREFLTFLSYARGSCGEVRSQLARALDRKHISNATFEDYNSQANHLNSMLSKLMDYLISTDIRGFKYRKHSSITPGKLRAQKRRRLTS
jgi:four helix bundle protein